MKTVIIQYTLSEAANVDDVERHIRDFVAGIAALGLGIRYASHRKRGVVRGYAHVAYIPDDDALAKMQAAPFFTAFAAYLPGVCSAPPNATFLDVVAATE